MLHYQIMDQSLTWSRMFGLLEGNAAQLDIVDYSLSQTTLEQVYFFALIQRKPSRCGCTDVQHRFQIFISTKKGGVKFIDLFL